jgi:hypothetical protein
VIEVITAIALRAAAHPGRVQRLCPEQLDADRGVPGFCRRSTESLQSTAVSRFNRTSTT